MWARVWPDICQQHDCVAVQPLPLSLRLAVAPKPALDRRIGGGVVPGQPPEAILPVTLGNGPPLGLGAGQLIYLLLITPYSDGLCYFQDVFSISF